MYAEFSEFLIRVAASFKAIHLHHHISELIKLPGYKIWPSWALRRGVHTRLGGVNSSRSPTQLLPHTRSRTPGRGTLGRTLRLSPPTNQRAFPYGKAQSIIVSSYQEVSYSRLFEYQWFVVNHLFIRLLSESDLRWMSVGIRKKHSLNSTGIIPI